MGSGRGLVGTAILPSCVVVAAVGACDGSSAKEPAVDGGVCAHPPGVNRPSFESVASGSITAADLSVLVCDVDVAVESSSDRVIASFGISGQSAVDFRQPEGARPGLLQGTFQIAAPTPGVYTSSDGMCGGFYFSYAFPIVPDADCEAGTSPSCPAGCAPACADGGCAGCVLYRPDVKYQATAATNCLVNTPQPVTGSWTLVLQSVVQDGPTTYAAHGTLTGTLTGLQGAGSATLALAF